MGNKTIHDPKQASSSRPNENQWLTDEEDITITETYDFISICEMSAMLRSCAWDYGQQLLDLGLEPTVEVRVGRKYSNKRMTVTNHNQRSSIFQL